jgi:hypothetical protein
VKFDKNPFFLYPSLSQLEIPLRTEEDCMKTVVVLLLDLALFSFCEMGDSRDWVNFESDDVYHAHTMKTAYPNQGKLL